MRRLKTATLGVDQGDIEIFSDFQNNGDMWTGSGPRERRCWVMYNEPFKEAPAVHVSISLWDVDGSTSVRAELTAENVSSERFEVVFKTWGDTRVARMRANWTAIGPLSDDDDWEIV